jgi:hypothetical protein
MSGQHARLSASSAHRWLACAGSAAGEKPADSSSIYSAAGTYAHDIAAKCLNDRSLSPGDFLLKRETVDGFEIECDMEMVDAVQLYIDDIDSDDQHGDISWVEMSLTAALQEIDPDLGGTADHVRYRASDKSVKMRDFKFGSGTYVEVDDNAQLKLYVLGTILVLLRQGYLVETVVMSIVQPRFEGAKPVRTYSFKAVDILDYVADVKAAAALSRTPNPPLVAGDHCGFCPKARTCVELEKRQHAIIAADFNAVTPYNVADLAKALGMVDLVKSRIKAIESFAYTEATRGVEIPGFKLVDKRPVRKWKSEDAVKQFGQANAVNVFEEPGLLSPAQLEKRLAETAPKGKKKEAGAVLEPLVEKISSGTTLVPVTDERAPAVRISAEDFVAIGGTAIKS